jgi:hypothetical protein
MGFTAVGLLPAVWGALLQAAIDVAVILNALRAVRSPSEGVHLDQTAELLALRFEREHELIRSDLERNLAVADALNSMSSAEVMPSVRQVHRTHTEEVKPHEAAEEQDFYPALARILGGSDPTIPRQR